MLARRFEPESLELGRDLGSGLEITFTSRLATHHRIVGDQEEPVPDIGFSDFGDRCAR